ncbi:DUF7619 domain-containing protein [Aureispira anguillae]|uniref:T9SS type A sorting domain-containing protein n=1 Tax=Aureispira anguillae TaxID=2864201 RepID=A0A916DVK3_9BACT|nr:T9SS type A sorting domain-containing protein [Aureispira anguillae]BDS13660.1 T9SS type A sorting domain-containing protein [Aureispira anguillae]
MKTGLFFIACLILFVNHTKAQTAAIPDTVFEQRLIQLGIDSDGLVNGQILKSDASGITTLQLNNTTGTPKITDLTGIGTFVDLVDLYCQNNDLDSIDVSGNLNLAYLFCANNNLKELDLSLNTGLLRLDCSGNDFDSIDISNNLALERLHCNNNNLRELDLTNHNALKRLYCTNNHLSTIDLSNNTLLDKLDCSANDLAVLEVTNNTALTMLYCHDNNLGLLDISNNTALLNFNCTGNLHYLRICVWDLAVANGFWGGKDPSARYSEDCFPLAVEGRVAIDDNFNCIADSLEQGLALQYLKFERLSDTTEVYTLSYDNLGNYLAYLDTGTYLVTLIPSGPYWQACPLSQTVTIDTNYQLQTLDWTLQELVACPMLEVDISAPFLRMTGGGSAYTVSYCNNGSIDAQNAYVEVDVDADLNVTNTSLPIFSQVGTVYTFDLGTVGVGQCGDFTMQVVVDTAAQFEQTHCTRVHIYPDSVCTPIWSGPRLGGVSSCQNDTVFFEIHNQGAAMAQPQDYTIIQDDIAMRVGTVQLGAGQSTIISQVAVEGSTYRIEVNQLAGYPPILGDAIFSTVVEGCNPFADGSFNTGFVTQFSNGSSSPFKAIDCQENIASYDPNDKAAQPEGYGTDHYIEQNIAIDYKIRFQNTGTDTAFNIVILDTLSNLVDIGSLQMGASSHAYNWAIEDGNVLKVSFPNILLVDSNANEPLSHGFFRYRIEQKNNNPLGAIIENQAAIYFDYNPPIYTNTTFHTIGENFVTSIVVSVDNIYEAEVEVSVFPNPFSEFTTLKVKGKEYQQLTLEVFDLAGRNMTVNQRKFNNQVQLSKGNLPTGVYFYQLKGDGKLLNTGKIVVQ